MFDNNNITYLLKKTFYIDFIGKGPNKIVTMKMVNFPTDESLKKPFLKKLCISGNEFDVNVFKNYIKCLLRKLFEMLEISNSIQRLYKLLNINFTTIKYITYVLRAQIEIMS